MKELTIEELREKVVTLNTELTNLTTAKETLEVEVETLKTNHATEIQAKDTSISELKQRNGVLFAQIPQKEEKNKDGKSEEKEISLDDLLTEMGMK